MHEIKAALAAVAERILGANTALKIARKRSRHFHNHAVRAHAAQVWAVERGYENRAARAYHRALKAHERAAFWQARRAKLNARLARLGHRQEELIADKQRWLKEHGVQVHGDKVTGGTPRQRLVGAARAAAALSASGARHSFYSQAGSWTVEHGITGEHPGQRSDCSQWVTSMYWSAGLDDPNGTGYSGGYTGTLGSHGKAISSSQLQPGDLVLYGSAPHHHVEMYVGPGDRTIGHGSAPVDAGVVNLFGDGNYYCRSYV